jgi:DNA-binding CsgD family transcriptional regulator
MLYGRREERALMGSLLAGARAGRSGVLVVRGPAGIGKRALLQDAAEQAAGFRLLRGAGVESEMELAFAGLHQLLQPALGRLDELPGPQASALSGAFGLAANLPNRFLTKLGVFSLLAQLAGEQPLLCLLTDAQWLDRPSADALVFVGRRLDTEPIVLLLAAEDSNGHRLHAAGLPSLRLGGLDREAAGQLLEARAGKIARGVRDRLIDQTGGHPLALVELPATLTVEQLTGHALLPERLPLGTRLQRAFLPAVRRLPPDTQTLLLIAAAEDTGDLSVVLAAGAALAVGAEALEPAERAGLVEVLGQELRFRHPLVRSAIYQGATFTARQAAHQAMITVLAEGFQADRRAWHLAAAAVGPDEAAAAALELSAGRAGERGGPATAAAALERAAALTLEPAPRARRLLGAAEYHWDAGRLQRVQMLLDQVQAAPAEPAVRARVAQLRGGVELATGSPAPACTLLIQGASLVLRSDPSRATEMLVLAARAALAANEPDRIVTQIAPAISSLPGNRDSRVERVAQGLIRAGFGQALPTTTDGRWHEPAITWPDPALAWVWPMLVHAEPTVDELTASGRYSRLVMACRAAGTVSALTVALANLAIAQASLGRWPEAIGTATEGLQLARATDQHATVTYFLALLAWFAAQQGRAEDCRQLADEALTTATSLRLPVVAAYASWTLAQLDLSDGQPDAALQRLLALATPGHPTAHAPIALLATGELVDAAVRADALDGIEPMVARFERWAERDQRTWTLGTAARCRALITQGDDAERHFQAALAMDGLGERPFQLARTELAYGEWLRRARRRAEARPHLRAALELFERLGAIPWADQARTELRATGETARRRDPSTLQDLTPQERQIASLAAQGLSNQQIADRLFLSSHTVGYHLHKVFAKLGVSSRGQLGQLDLDDHSR